MLDETEPNDSSAEPPEKTPLSASTLNWQQRKIYGRRSTELVKSYFRCMYELATHANFLMRCRAMRMVRRPYRVECDAIKNTRHVDRILDECSYRLMLADLDYNRLRKVQVSGLLERLHEQMKIIMSQEDLSSVVVMAKTKYENMFEGVVHESPRFQKPRLICPAPEAPRLWPRFRKPHKPRTHFPRLFCPISFAPCRLPRDERPAL
ncbi:hypothetical protein HPB48_009656 [Haemaphysalis longicornis]|uniref:Uncharacterized protein n=1 Tax=Haemaphysalis longicornis TaxID=44386 RepID=A0A9J6FDR8_HAELO|nr:hypothetical protein HPB48_009656 [Haemaphysalis longicornis]